MRARDVLREARRLLAREPMPFSDAELYAHVNDAINYATSCAEWSGEPGSTVMYRSGPPAADVIELVKIGDVWQQREVVSDG